MGRGRRQGKTPTPPVKMVITLELFKYENVKGDTFPKAGPLDPQKEPEDDTVPKAGQLDPQKEPEGDTVPKAGPLDPQKEPEDDTVPKAGPLDPQKEPEGDTVPKARPLDPQKEPEGDTVPKAGPLDPQKEPEGDTVPKAGPLDPQKEPEGFLQQFLSENKDRPEIREYLDKIEERRLQQRRIETDTQRGRGRDGEEKKGLAKKAQNFPTNGISRKEALKRRRERKAWKAMWAKIFPPVVRKTASKEKSIRREVVPTRTKTDDKSKAENGLVEVRMRVFGGNPTVRDMENMEHLVEIVKDSEYVRKALNL